MDELARIRSIKPEFWSSPGIEQADPWSRLLYVALWNWADDSGVGTANPRELLGFAFPLDEKLTLVDLRRMLVEIRRVFGVDFYTVAGRAYYQIPSWDKHQKFDRRSKGKYPTSDQAETWLYLGEGESDMEIRVNPTSPRRDSVAGTGEQGNRGTGEKESVSPSVKAPPQSKTRAPEHVATDNAYARTGKAFNFVAARGIAKWALREKGLSVQEVEDAFVAIHEMGKPITKQIVDQFVNGSLPHGPRRSSPRVIANGLWEGD
ncbi:hypothetical protein [Rhodococcus jostii]|uniref:hypothetical protein n=1 Tax=Rhodococcus jostii TaxID=132919 RepID=UPI00363E1581